MRNAHPSADDEASRVITRVALLLALVVGLGIPLGYWLTAHTSLSEALTFKARVKASALNRLIADAPELWVYAENRMLGLLAHEPVPLTGELIEVLDAQGQLLVRSGAVPANPVMHRSYQLYDSGRAVGSIAVSTSLQPLLRHTGLATLLGLALGNLVYWVMRVVPLRRLRRATQALTEETERAEATLRSISDAVITLTADGKLQDLNPAGVAIFEADRAQHMLGRRFTDFVTPAYHETFALMHQQVTQGQTAQCQLLTQGLRGALRWLDIQAVPLTLHNEQVTLAVARDVTQRKAAEDEIRSLAFHDQLTGLPNRHHLMHRLARLANADDHSHTALMMLDLDNFKTLNDTLGHDVGDQLLQAVAQRLTACVRHGDNVVRLGGDEFVLLLENLDPDLQQATHQAEVIGQKVLAELNHLYLLDGHPCRSTPSIGITVFANTQAISKDVLKRADLAMYQAKAGGRNALRLFETPMMDEVNTRAELEADLIEAFEQKQFVLHYQAQVQNDGRISGAEVLLRWQHPRRGLVLPGEFIEALEDSGLIIPIGQWVLESACRQLAQWAQQTHMAHLSLAVNVSARQFELLGFVDQVSALLQHTGAKPALLKLELTESLLVKDVESTITKMTRLRALGVRFSLDDFGTGYSSLTYLKRLPLDQLKIDQGFVRDILDDANDAAIAKMIVALADSIGLIVIAEGVETQAQRDMLASLGCHAYQGYLFGPPVPLPAFEAQLR
ncbi:GGDEF and EAL domain-containing protein [Rhodoferax sp. U11-2br]|uniref:putative bifunctional diguanylate cyclase/phosphodiesterase n=1 Tax=Rhodoferax sp. U11-2br TaxID=2838878 RepID=UPI001BE4F4C8|nr:EAL domain-containing protein [Rhodoferax sp. U11-2br]